MSELPTPDLRPAPPWVMEEMIAAEPALADGILGDDAPMAGVAAAVGVALRERRRVAVVGCGTSEHAAMAVASLLEDAARRSGAGEPGSFHARQAFEAALDPWPDGLVVGISHEGETPATVAALAAARRAGSATALITANDAAPAAEHADRVVVTPLIDRSWCHTVGYVSPMLAGAGIAAALVGERLDPAAVAAYLTACLGLRDAAAAVAEGLADIDRVVICGSGVDLIGARELALKVEEGVRMPAVGRETETELHGHMVSADERCGLVAIVADPARTGPRAARADHLLRAARRLGMPTAAIVAAGAGDAWDAATINAGTIELPEAGGVPGGVPPVLAALAGTAIALQLLTVALVHRAGTNPDRIRREEDAYRESADVASASFPI